MRRARYRIVRDTYSGFEAQFRPWWSPFWFMVNGCNTKPNLETAEKLCRTHATRGNVVKYLGELSAVRDEPEVERV